MKPAYPLLLAALLYLLLQGLGWHELVRTLRGPLYRATRSAGQVSSGSSMQAQVDALAAENEQLRRLLQLPRTGWKLSLTAHCLERNTERPFGDLWFDRGARDGVNTRVVALHGSGLVGRVVEVRASQCRVRPVLHPEARVPVLLGKTRLQGVLHGQGWQLVAEQVRPRPLARPGELVVTSGLGQIYPAGVLVGVLRRPLASDDPLFARYEVEPSVLLDEVLQVLLVEVGS